MGDAVFLHDEAHVRAVILEHKKRAYANALRQVELGCKGAWVNFASAAAAYINELEKQR